MSSPTLILSLRRYARRAAHVTPFPIFLLVLLALLWFHSAWRIAFSAPDRLWPSDSSSPEQRLWRRFPPPAFAPREKRDLFMPVDVLPDACLESWIGQGNPCTSAELGPKEFLPTRELDVVWPWVNGSDPVWRLQLERRLKEIKNIWPPVEPRHYRSGKDELRHSLRSVVQHLDPPPRRMYIIVGDWEDDDHPGMRKGQVPEWLALGRNDRRIVNQTDGSEVILLYHSEIFQGDGRGGDEAQRAYINATVPNFNSLAIESYLHALPGVSKDFAYFNDDCFLNKKHTHSDFLSPVYGSVVRMPSVHSTTYWPIEFPEPGCRHQASAAHRSAWIFAQRFPHKNRVMHAHVAKTVSQPMLLEARMIWEDEARDAAKRRIREDNTGPLGDQDHLWLSMWLYIERARESMLWTWAVVRLGGDSGVWGAEERKEVRTLLGLKDGDKDGDSKERDIHKAKRETIKKETIKKALEPFGEESPKAVQYIWSSLDGPLPGQDGGSPCKMIPSKCFGSWIAEDSTESIPATEMFKKLAFPGDAHCGDCVLSAIVAKSGSKGLSALLPAPSQPYTLPAEVAQSLNEQQQEQPHLKHDVQPHMPMTPRWNETDFSLAGVIALTNPTSPETATVDLRTFTLQLIARYQHVQADSAGSSFFQFTDPRGFGGVIQKLKEDKKIATLAMNDDMEEPWPDLLEPLIRTWLGVQWPFKGWWER